MCCNCDVNALCDTIDSICAAISNWFYTKYLNWKEPVGKAGLLFCRIVPITLFLTFSHALIYGTGMYERLISNEWYRVLTNSPYTVTPPPSALLLFAGTIAANCLTGVAAAYTFWLYSGFPSLGMGNVFVPVYYKPRVAPFVAYVCLVVCSWWWMSLLLWDATDHPTTGLVMAALTVGCCTTFLWSVCAYSEPLAMVCTVAMMFYVFGLNMTAAIGWGNRDETGDERLWLGLRLNKGDMTLEPVTQVFDELEEYAESIF